MAEKLRTPKTQSADILEEEYNVAPYPSFPFSQTHPAHLFTLAKLFGLQPKAVEKARVLELGCAGGGNLIPMAYHFPTAEFLGIDLSEKQINDGIKCILDLNIKNITLRHQSILDFNNTDGKFDYIICHGVYSWVDDKVRDKIMKICHEALSKNGIAYISYNTLPGWNMVNSVKDLMSWHAKNFADPATKAQQARSILKFISDGLQEEKSPYADCLRNEISVLANQSDSYLLHEHLSTYNKPLYFYQFMESANKQKLSYLSDAFLATMFTDNLPPRFATELNKINNIITIGQYMDFIRNQRFRCTLLCHEDNIINRSLQTADIEHFYLQLVGKPDNPNFSQKDIDAGTESTFTHGTITLKVRNPISQLAMLILTEEQFKPIHYNDLCQKLIERSSIKDLAVIKRHLNDELNLMRSVFAGIINISSYANDYTVVLSEKPVACPLVRYQAQHQNHVTNRRHQNLVVDPLSKVILPLLDGTHDIDAILKAVHQEISKGNLIVLDENKQTIKDQKTIEQRTKIICQNTLANMAKQAIFIR